MARIVPPSRRGAPAWAVRAALFLGAAFVAAACAELGLRTAGALIRRAEPRDYGTGGAGKIRVLCLGESTTAWRPPDDYSWPAQLQARLDAAAAGKFEVLNRGRSGIDTDVIADRLPWLLDAERPGIVVTMMGINDVRKDLRLAPQEPDTFALLRVWRWARREVGRRAWLARLGRRARSDRPEDADRRRQACPEIMALGVDVGGLDLCVAEAEAAAPGWKALVASGAALIVEGRRSEAEKRFDLALRSAPKEREDVQAGIAQSLERLGEFDGFERHWKAAWAARPWDERLVELRFARLLAAERYSEAAALAREAVARYPRKALGPTLLFESETMGWNRASNPAGPEVFRAGEAARRLAPDDVDLLLGLSSAYMDAGRGDAADAIMDSLRRRDGLHQGANLLIARYFAQRGRMAEAAEVYLRIAAQESVYRGTIEKFAEKLLAAGRRDEAARLYDYIDEERRAPQVLAVDRSHSREVTRENYERVGRALRARGVAWIAMQYPLRPVETLRALTADFPEVVLVENRNNFLDAQGRVPPPALFSDRFAGDFGHCTREGNSLIADSAARAVLAAAR